MHHTQFFRFYSGVSGSEVRRCSEACARLAPPEPVTPRGCESSRVGENAREAVCTPEDTSTYRRDGLQTWRPRDVRAAARGCELHRAGGRDGGPWTEYVSKLRRSVDQADPASLLIVAGNLPHYTVGGSVHLVVK